MKHWQSPPNIIVPDDLQAAVGGHPVVAATLYQRGIDTPTAALSFMNWHHYTPAPPGDLPDMDRAVARLRAAVKRREVICVWGDFDVDGQTSTALLVSMLRRVGANVVSYIPKRLTEGHGIDLNALKRQLDGGVSLVLTCDTGVDAHDAVNYASTRGVNVIVTDHHKLPETLPDAYAVVNPRRVPPGHPLRDLPGVGVAYKLAEAFMPGDEDPSDLLDLVALGIVADVAIQRGDTRYLLQRGLLSLANTQRAGLRAIMQLAEVNQPGVNESDIAFRIAPRLNAIGRLDDANMTTDLLTTRSPERAEQLANQLEGLNAERRRLSDEVWHGVQAKLEREPHLLKHAALVVGHPSWHTGVVGIVANKCVEQYDRPALLLATPPDGLAKGSARSVAGVDITDAIAANADLLVGYGGHTMAAGVALEAANVDAFRRGLSEQVLAQMADLDLTPTLKIDSYLGLGEVSLSLVRDVGRLAPFGAGNTPITFATRGVTILERRQLGRDGRHQRLTVEDDVGGTLPIVWWNAEDIPAGYFDVAYTLRESTFRGEQEVLAEWVGYRQVESSVIDVRPERDIVTHDHRAALNPVATLKQVLAEAGEGVLVWAEVETPPGVAAVRRTELVPAETLVVWTIPPSVEVWEAALAAVQPKQLHLFATDPGVDAPPPFLIRLAGALKHVIRAKGGQVPLPLLAGALAAREDTVLAALRLLDARGDFAVTLDGETVQVMPGEGKPSGSILAPQPFQKLLEESAAYRSYWRRIPKF